MTTDAVDCLVIGAGVVGLAIAARLARDGREVIVLDAERRIGAGTSSRNSEVIHAGLYYQPGSLKARLCLAGRQQLYSYCDARGIPYRRCGKLIVATTDAERAALDRIEANATACGVDEFARWSKAEVAAAEPALTCVEALHSPSTGIVDSHQLMLALQGDIEANDGMIALGAPVLRGRCDATGVTLQVGGAEPTRVTAEWTINSAGLQAQAVAAALSGFPQGAIPKLHLAKGNYFALPGAAPASRLVYPVPAGGGLGIHLTLDLAGQARFGPDVEWIEAVAYDVDALRSAGFYESIRRYWPGLRDGGLVPAYAGVRPKLAPPGHPPADFMIQGPADHGRPGLINLFGIESPGLTASLALGDEVASLCRRRD